MKFVRKKTFDQKIDEAPLPTGLTLKRRGKKRKPIKKLTTWEKIVKWISEHFLGGGRG